MLKIMYTTVYKLINNIVDNSNLKKLPQFLKEDTSKKNGFS